MFPPLFIWGVISDVNIEDTKLNGLHPATTLDSFTRLPKKKTEKYRQGGTEND